MPGLRSLRNRLAVVFGLIVLGAIATMYIAVTPLLEERLTEQKLNGLVEDAQRYERRHHRRASRPAPRAPRCRRRVATAAAGSSAEVLVLEPLTGRPLR